MRKKANYFFEMLKTNKVNFLIFCCFLLICCMSRQYALYYAPKSRNTKNLQMRVQESADGKDMLY